MIKYPLLLLVARQYSKYFSSYVMKVNKKRAHLFWMSSFISIDLINQA